eukprot:7009946-Lingulodinium_polyedra.AAC.1
MEPSVAPREDASEEDPEDSPPDSPASDEEGAACTRSRIFFTLQAKDRRPFALRGRQPRAPGFRYGMSCTTSSATTRPSGRTKYGRSPQGHTKVYP